MFDIEKNLDDKIFSMRKIKPTVMFSCYESQRVISASLRLLRVAKVVLLAPEDKIARFARHKCTNLSETQIEYLLTYIRAVDIAKEKDLHEEFAQEYVKISKGKKWEASLLEARKLTAKPPMFSIMAVKLGYADMAFGGLRYGPQEFFRPSMQILTTEDTPFEAGIFVLPEGRTIRKAVCTMGADNEFALNVNGHVAGQGKDYRSARDMDVTRFLRAGKNMLSVLAANAPSADVPAERNPAALIGVIHIEFDEGDPLTIVTDGDWRVSKDAPQGWQEVGFDASGWPTAMDLGAYGRSPWGRLRRPSTKGSAVLTQTKDGSVVYVILRVWPGNAYRSDLIEPAPNSRITMLGYDRPLRWTLGGGETTVFLPQSLQNAEDRPAEHAWVLKVQPMKKKLK